MLLNLLHLARLTGDGALSDKAEKQVRAFAGEVADNPRSIHFYVGLDFYLGPSESCNCRQVRR